jgi:hypothetical protein
MSALKKRRYLQFTLRWLLVAITGLAVWLAVQVNRAHRQSVAVQTILRGGGTVHYDHQRTGVMLGSEPEPATTASARLRRWLGEDLFRSVTRVTLANVPDMDRCLAALRDLPLVEVLQADTSPIDPEDGFYQGWDRFEMKLRGEPASDRTLGGLRKLKRLRHLTLGGARITDDGLRHLGELHRLERLELYRTPIAGDGLEHLVRLKNLKLLDLRSSRVTDAGLAHLKALPQLETLSLDRTRITDAGLRHLRELKSLKLLGVAENNVSDAGLVHLRELRSLETLLLNDTRITDAGLVHLAALAELNHLHLHCTAITDAAVAHLHSLPELRSLDLRCTLITDRGLHELTSIGTLEQLSIDQAPLRPIDLDVLNRQLRYGRVGQPRTTPAGIKAFQQALPKCEVRS